MRRFSFLTKLAFICNLMFLVAFGMRYNDAALPQWGTGTILVLGWFLSVLLNIIFIIWLLFVLIYDMALLGHLPGFLCFDLARLSIDGVEIRMHRAKVARQEFDLKPTRFLLHGKPCAFRTARIRRAP